MILAIDIGNSNIKIAVWTGAYWTTIQRIDASKQYDHHSYVSYVLGALSCNTQENATLDIQYITTAIISTVTPYHTDKIIDAIKSISHCKIIRVSIHLKSPLSGGWAPEIGQDLFANAVASYDKNNAYSHQSLNSYASIAVDMGTALTFTAVRSDGSIAGVTIAPGLQTTYQALIANAAQLESFPLEVPKSILGHNTKDAINSGMLFGFKYLIQGMIDHIKTTLSTPSIVYATGGLASFMKQIVNSSSTTFDVIDSYHTLHGLKVLAEYNTATK